MAANGAPDSLIRCVYEGCISGGDGGIERRPYHRNCSCALHKSRGSCSHTSLRNKNISYPIKKSWSEGCLALMASTHYLSSPPSSPSLASRMPRSRLSCSSFEEDEE